MIQLRANGMKSQQIAKQDGVPLQAIYDVLKSIYEDGHFPAGVADNTGGKALWARERCLDLPAAPDTPEDNARARAEEYEGCLMDNNQESLALRSADSYTVFLAAQFLHHVEHL